jgi:hypothetical protein
VCLVRDEDTLQSLGLNTGAMLYFKDRGMQIGWTTVFLSEYAGPLFVYLWFYRWVMVQRRKILNATLGIKRLPSKGSTGTGMHHYFKICFIFVY